MVLTKNQMGLGACQRPGMSNRRKVKNSAEANGWLWTYTHGHTRVLVRM